MFQINEVLELGTQKYRVLSLHGEDLVWISIDNKSSFPSIASIAELISALEAEKLKRCEDPFSYLAFEMPEDGSTAKTKRDDNFELIKSIVELPDYYLPKPRAAKINQIIEQRRTTKQTLYRLIRQYWQRGQTVNALLPDYKNSGGKGQKRKAGGRKLGRPRKYMPGTGVNIDELTERLFRIAIDKYLLRDKGHTFSYAYRRFKDLYENYFPETPEEEIPTNWQMNHFYKREYKQPKRLSGRVSKIQYNKDMRPLLSTANTQVIGPGSRFEIDATIADIYLVSDHDRSQIVGRPVVYMVIDVFSRMVAGFYVGFENPSYVAALQALNMAMINKAAFCKKFGFDIEDHDWPVVGLPDAILADRGELLGHQIESLESNFSVRIENTPPYRGDAKGIVERSFKALHADFTLFAPGSVTGTKVKKRGGKDYRLDAKLSVSDFKGIILSSVLYHNQFETLKKYDRDADMPPELPLVPLELWRWGLQHRTGRLRAASAEAVRLNLLPRKTATVSELGIRLFSVFYTAPEAIALGWMHRSKNVSRPAKVEVAYDPATADNIYLFPKKNCMENWVCKLSDRSREFQHLSFWEVWDKQEAQKTTMGATEVISEKKKRQHEQLVMSKIKQAEKLAADISHLTKAERIASISQNRNNEKQRERGENKPAIDTSEATNNVVKLTESENENYSYPTFIDELFDDED